MPSLPPEDTNPAAAEHPLEPKRARGWGDIRTWIQNSPWFAIAILIHILVVAVMSVIYITHDRPKPADGAQQIQIARTPLVLPDAIEEPPEIIDRNSVPILDNQDEGPVNPD